MAKKKVVKKSPIKEGDVLDIQPTVDAFKEVEMLNVEAAKAAVKEIEEIQNAPDFPKIERWGHKGPLTIASPGDIVEDPTYIPESVETNSGGRRRIACHRIIEGQTVVLTADGRRKFRWCRYKDATRISSHRRRGFRFEDYRKLFKGTGLFEDVGVDHQIHNGDLVLMSIPMDGWERMRAEKKRLQAALEASHGSELFDAGARAGVPTFKEDFNRGVREYYT